MKKRDKIIYWIATIWLALGMASSGTLQLIGGPEMAKPVLDMGYPMYFLKILGSWKLLGVVALLAPRFPVVKEWAYAGFFFTASGALISHLVNRHAIGEIFPAVLLLVLTTVSWYFRPAERRFPTAIQIP
jgi:hypothetical protein